MPGEVMKASNENHFVTPSQLIDRCGAGRRSRCAIDDLLGRHRLPRGFFPLWLGNAMQSNALHELYKLEGPLKDKGDEQLLTDWRRLGSSDHLYYMSTKYWADGDVHKYFSPYESPYDSYINFMNVLDNIQTRLRE